MCTISLVFTFLIKVQFLFIKQFLKRFKSLSNNNVSQKKRLKNKLKTERSKLKPNFYTLI